MKRITTSESLMIKSDPLNTNYRIEINKSADLDISQVPTVWAMMNPRNLQIICRKKIMKSKK